MFVGYRNLLQRWRMMGLGMNPPRQSYIDKVLSIQSANLIAYWPLNETAGGVADNIQGVAARDGAYTGVALNSIVGPDGVNGAPLFDGINDECDIYSASLNTAWSAPAAATIAIWARVLNAGVWADGVSRVLLNLSIDGTNQIRLTRANANDQLSFVYLAGGTSDQFELGSISTTDWMHIAMTWDRGVDEVKAYFNGSLESTRTGLGILAGNLNSSLTMIGANSSNVNVWSGYLAHGLISTIAYTPAEILDLATV